MIKQRIDQVLSQPVSRKTFLAQIGFVALAVIGIPAILKSLEHKSSDSAAGYGGSTYGGRSLPTRKRLL